MQPTTTTLKPQDCLTIAHYHSKLSSPLIIDDTLYCVAQNGDILKYSENGEVQVLFTILGQPSSLAYRDNEEYFIVSDFAHQSIFAREGEKNEQIHNLISDFNNRAFVGPNTVKVGTFSRNMYFTDSGAFLETSIENRQGSVFMYNFDTESVSCLAFRTLAYPSGLQCDEQEKYLIVSQTAQNRLLKFYLTEPTSSSSSAGNHTVFHQFSGRMGPTSICRFQTFFYVALYQFQQMASSGAIAVINHTGEMVERFFVPIGAEITGLFINQQVMVNHCSSIYVSEGNKVHKVTLKNQTESKLGDSILIKSQQH